MPSPFPGMNPYLEQPDDWLDFHKTFLIKLREQVVQQLRPRYIARVERRFQSEVPGDESSGDDRHRWICLEVRDRLGGEVVTTIELLSPSNKATGPDRDVYWAKVRRVLRSSANFVEIDLLRGGPRMSWGDLPKCDYYALVSRPETRPQADIWPIGLRDRLPEIPIPVRPGEPGARVDLQALLHRVYDGAGFEDSIYTTEPEPRLAPADAAWAAQFRPPGGA